MIALTGCLLFGCGSFGFGRSFFGLAFVSPCLLWPCGVFRDNPGTVSKSPSLREGAAIPHFFSGPTALHFIQDLRQGFRPTTDF